MLTAGKLRKGTLQPRYLDELVKNNSLEAAGGRVKLGRKEPDRLCWVGQSDRLGPGLVLVLFSVPWPSRQLRRGSSSRGHPEHTKSMDFNNTRYIPMSRRRRIYEGKAKVLYEGPEP